MTPGERLQRLLDAKGWTQEEAAAELAVARWTVNRLVLDRQGMTAEMAVRLETVFDEGPTARQWLGFQARADLARARETLRAFTTTYDKRRGRRAVTEATG